MADFDDLDVDSFISETIGSAIIDCGCSSSVCGELWLKTYKDTLSCKEKESIVYNSSNRWYRFGDGKKVKAIKNIILPLHIGHEKTTISVDVVGVSIPLLFSKTSLSKLGSNCGTPTQLHSILQYMFKVYHV